MSAFGALTRPTATVVLTAVVATAAIEATRQSAAPPELFTRVGLTADEAARAIAGQPAVRVLPGSVDTEVAVAGAIRIRGDVERLALWLRDIAAFRRALGSDAVGAIDAPARVENFSVIGAVDVDAAALERCRPGGCEIRMPVDYAARLAREVPWGTPDAEPRAARLVQQLLTEYAAAYQAEGDRGLDRLHGRDAADPPGELFRDMLRRAVPVWRLAYELAAYLEEFPGSRPPGIEDRFYWTREAGDRKPIATLHHVALQRLPDRSLRIADKQFYASRDIDAALLIGQATPTADGRAFDLVLSVRARVPRAGSLAGRLLRDRIGQEMAEVFASYLTWLQQSFAQA